MTTIENKCEHLFLVEKGWQKDKNGIDKFLLGDCFKCGTTIVISKEYQKIDAYVQLKDIKKYLWYKNGKFK